MRDTTTWSTNSFFSLINSANEAISLLFMHLLSSKHKTNSSQSLPATSAEMIPNQTISAASFKTVNNPNQCVEGLFNRRTLLPSAFPGSELQSWSLRIDLGR